MKKSARRPKRKAEERSVRRDVSTDNAATWPHSDFFNALLWQDGTLGGGQDFGDRDAVLGVPAEDAQVF